LCGDRELDAGHRRRAARRGRDDEPDRGATLDGSRSVRDRRPDDRCAGGRGCGTGGRRGVGGSGAVRKRDLHPGTARRRLHSPAQRGRGRDRRRHGTGCPDLAAQLQAGSRVTRPVLRSLAIASAFAAVLTGLAAPAGAVNIPSPCPSPAASGSRCVAQNASPYDELKTRLGGDLARALSTQQKLSAALAEAAATEVMLADQLTQEESKITDLQNQVASLDQEISDLEARIAIEREQISALARAMYERPASFLDLIASSGDLGQALASSADLVVAGQRAHALQERLSSDL